MGPILGKKMSATIEKNRNYFTSNEKQKRAIDNCGEG